MKWRLFKRKKVASTALPIEREFPPGQMPLVANHFVAQNDGPEFYLMFFWINSPTIVADDPVDRARQFAELGSVTAQCVARVVMSTERLPAVIKVMQEQASRMDALQYPVDGIDTID